MTSYWSPASIGCSAVLLLLLCLLIRGQEVTVGEYTMSDKVVHYLKHTHEDSEIPDLPDIGFVHNIIPNSLSDQSALDKLKLRKWSLENETSAFLFRPESIEKVAFATNAFVHGRFVPRSKQLPIIHVQGQSVMEPINLLKSSTPKSDSSAELLEIVKEMKEGAKQMQMNIQKDWNENGLVVIPIGPMLAQRYIPKLRKYVEKGDRAKLLVPPFDDRNFNNYCKTGFIVVGLEDHPSIAAELYESNSKQSQTVANWLCPEIPFYLSIAHTPSHDIAAGQQQYQETNTQRDKNQYQHQLQHRSQHQNQRQYQQRDQNQQQRQYQQRDQNQHQQQHQEHHQYQQRDQNQQQRQYQQHEHNQHQHQDQHQQQHQEHHQYQHQLHHQHHYPDQRQLVAQVNDHKLPLIHGKPPKKSQGVFSASPLTMPSMSGRSNRMLRSLNPFERQLTMDFQ